MWVQFRGVFSSLYDDLAMWPSLPLLQHYLTNVPNLMRSFFSLKPKQLHLLALREHPLLSMQLLQFNWLHRLRLLSQPITNQRTVPLHSLIHNDRIKLPTLLIWQWRMSKLHLRRWVKRYTSLWHISFHLSGMQHNCRLLHEWVALLKMQPNLLSWLLQLDHLFGMQLEPRTFGYLDVHGLSGRWMPQLFLNWPK